jgi:NAD(P)-dependent dehydrogenase (short-subunit alcohol dehydrogenase family)
MGKLSGKVAIVTGGGTGVGKKTSQVLAGHGAQVVVSGYLPDEADIVADAIRAAGGEASAVRVDVGEEEQISAMVEHALSAFGGVDILINNAALTDPAYRAKDRDVVNADADTWDQVMRINLRGPMLAAKYAIPQMIARGGGAIVNISSGMGMFGELTQTAYGVSKAAINHLTKYIATQYGKDKVRCNSLPLGFIVTDADNENKKKISPELIKIFMSNHLTPYAGSGQHVADTIAFLVSDEAAYITGQVIPVDGGVTTHSPLYAQVTEMFAASGINKF